MIFCAVTTCFHLMTFLVILFIEPTNQWQGSKLGTTEYNQEMYVINQGIEDYKAAMNVNNRNGVLCVTFIKGSLKQGVKTLNNNLVMTVNTCLWAVIIYQGTPAEVENICRPSPINLERLVHCQLSKYAIVSNSTKPQAVPKTILYTELLPYLKNFERVFLMDEDISIHGFNMAKYIKIWDCAFYPYRPLLTQPLIAESTQFFDFVNWKFWRNRGYIASSVGLIEQQVPFFDSIFFEWFVRRVLVYTKEQALRLGADCGHDRSWCNAARMYSQHVLGWPTELNRTAPCALITGATPVHHLNMRSMATKKANRGKFRAMGHAGVQNYINYFPTWVILEVKNSPNPLGKKHSHRYLKVRNLDRAGALVPRCREPKVSVK